jgi:hypothetical protein
MKTMSTLEYEIELGSFNWESRRDALQKLYRMLCSGQVSVVPELALVNLHCHTFFSFNAYGYSPTAYAWEAKKRGLYGAGIVDFDVLDGVEEFLESCDLLGLRCHAGIESRVIVSEWRNREINSPGKPGICYFMGSGFTSGAPELRNSHDTLWKMYTLAQRRNRVMIEKLNHYLGEVSLDYEEDVLPLTPSGNATERHMLAALHEKSLKLFPDRDSLARFWSHALQTKQDNVETLLDRPVELQMLIRSKLMKQGGPGHSIPDDDSFPQLEEMITMVQDLGAVPTHTWLNGLCEGEKDGPAALDFMIEKGAACLNIIPDRNWNIVDNEERNIKVEKLYEIVREAAARDLVIIVGTEMNRQGQRFVDDFFAEPMKPVGEEFMRGARIMTGHTLLSKHIGIGLLSSEVKERFRGNLEKRNRFFERAGSLSLRGGFENEKAVNRQVRDIWERGI